MVVPSIAGMRVYSESNMVHLRRGADAPGAGKGAEHDIIEADE